VFLCLPSILSPPENENCPSEIALTASSRPQQGNKTWALPMHPACGFTNPLPDTALAAKPRLLSEASIDTHSAHEDARSDSSLDNAGLFEVNPAPALTPPQPRGAPSPMQPSPQTSVGFDFSPGTSPNPNHLTSSACLSPIHHHRTNPQYMGVRRLVRELLNGPTVIPWLDAAVDACNHIVNLRSAIGMYRGTRSSRLLAQPEVSRMQQAFSRDVVALARYCLLLAYAAFLDRLPEVDMEGALFTSWVASKASVQVRPLLHLSLVLSSGRCGSDQHCCTTSD
jgi:hypothetical protein